MSNSRSVYQNSSGQWVNKRDDASRATDLHRTQQQAIDAAKDDLRNAGGGELSVHGLDGRIRSKDTIAPGNDPNPPRDTEH